MLLLFEWLPRSEVLVASLVPLVLISLSFHHILVIRLRCKQVESIENGCVILALSFLGYLTDLVFGALEAAISKFSILNDDIVGRGAVLVLLLILYKVLRHDSDLNFNGWKNVEMKAPKADITHHALLVSPGKPRTTSWLLRSEVIVASLVPLVLISLSFHHILVIRLRCKQVESIESGYVLVWRNPQVLHPERRHCRSWSRPCAASDLVLPGLRI
ncbi:hypothetical protein YC2023_060758 [Brassica napus]